MKIAVLGESSRFQPSELSGNCGAILLSVVWTSLEYSATTCGGSLLPVIADSSICSLSTGYLQASVCKMGCKDAGNSNRDSWFLEQQGRICSRHAARALLSANISREDAGNSRLCSAQQCAPVSHHAQRLWK